MKQCVRANIRASVNQLRHGSGMLESMIGQGRLTVVGAEYSLETGIVDFLEN
jgi:carbonic anhydrase